jgi:hypothetical protein
MKGRARRCEWSFPDKGETVIMKPNDVIVQSQDEITVTATVGGVPVITFSDEVIENVRRRMTIAVNMLRCGAAAVQLYLASALPGDCQNWKTSVETTIKELCLDSEHLRLDQRTQIDNVLFVTRKAAVGLGAERRSVWRIFRKSISLVEMSSNIVPAKSVRSVQRGGLRSSRLRVTA